MFEFGIEKILLIMLVILLLFGAKRIPEIGSSLGRGIRDFKRSMNDLQNDVQTNLDTSSPDMRTPVPRRDPAAVPRTDDVRSEPKRLIG